MRYEIISSSSKGNCIIVDDFFMLDCGVSYAKIKPYLKKVKLIFISHLHQDHLNLTTIKKIAYEKPTIKFVVGSVDIIDKLLKSNVKSSNIYALISNAWNTLGAIRIRLERVTHDVPNHLCKFEINGKKGIYIVDTENVDNIEAKNYDLYLIEANYDENTIEEHILNCEDKNKLYYLNRAKNTHLSQQQANSFLIENMGEHSNYVYIHKSNYNYKELD